MSLEQQISKGIMEAMKAKDTVRLGASVSYTHLTLPTNSRV